MLGVGVGWDKLVSSGGVGWDKLVSLGGASENENRKSS